MSIPYLQTYKTRGVTYYRYRMPDGTYKSLGKDRQMAEEAARLANQERERREHRSPNLGSGETMLELIDTYEEVKRRTTNSAASANAWHRKFNQYRRTMADWRVARVGVRDLDQWLEVHAPDYDPYRLHRLLFRELFAYALGKGWRSEASGNPGAALLPPKLARKKIPKQRVRMTLEQFNAIREFAPGWLQLGMDLALQIGIRRSDVCRIKLSDYSGGRLRFIPSKTADLPTPAAVSIQMEATLFEKSRQMPPLSPYFLHKVNAFHRSGEATGRDHRTQVLPEQVSRHFNVAREEAIQAYPELFAGLKSRQLPGFHEIRALCAWLYKQQGRSSEEVQVLLGHHDVDMTQYYQSGHEFEWQETWAGLSLSR